MVEKRLLTSLYNTDSAQVVKSWAMLVQDLELEHPVGTVKITSDDGVLTAWYVPKEEKETTEHAKKPEETTVPFRDTVEIKPGQAYCAKCLGLEGTHITRNCNGEIEIWPEEPPTAETLIDKGYNLVGIEDHREIVKEHYAREDRKNQ